MTAIAKPPARKIARPLKVLVPLIQQELTEGHSAGLEHYRQAGEMLIEAKEQVSRGSWGRWLRKNFELSDDTARNYMRLARVSENPNGVREMPQSIREVTGQTVRDREKKAAWKPFFKEAAKIDTDEYARQRQAAEEEVRLHRELAQELINLGYKALAMRLHPDRGGSKDAMSRLTRVRDELQAIAQSRRFL